jgi:hypothetical protein
VNDHLDPVDETVMDDDDQKMESGKCRKVRKTYQYPSGSALSSKKMSTRRRDREKEMIGWNRKSRVIHNQSISSAQPANDQDLLASLVKPT